MTGPPFAIRPAAATDLDALLALERAIATAPHWPAADYAAIIAGTGTVPRILLVAVTAAGLAGFAVVSIVADESELETIAVAHPHRRQGIARALLVELLLRLPARVCRLEVRASSTGAIALYRQLGFQVVGTRPAYYRHPAEDALLLERECGPESGQAGPGDV